MGQFEAGKWIIGIVVYYFFLFIILSMTSSMIREIGVHDRMLNYTDVGFFNKSNEFFNNPDGICRGRGNSMNFLENILCNQLEVFEDENTCNNVSGCSWVNETDLFGIAVSPAGCSGVVNKSAYNISGGIRNYCSSPGLQDQGTCEMFKCPWIDRQQLAEEQADSINSNNLNTFWDSIKFIVTFRANFGLGSYNWLISFLLFYIPMLMLLWCIYMALPFLH